MNRQEFLEKLRLLLGDLSEEEREEAIQYYEDYFADAGPEMEEQVIRELGSPEKVALMIREAIREKSQVESLQRPDILRAGTTTGMFRQTTLGEEPGIRTLTGKKRPGKNTGNRGQTGD